MPYLLLSQTAKQCPFFLSFSFFPPTVPESGRVHCPASLQLTRWCPAAGAPPGCAARPGVPRLFSGVGARPCPGGLGSWMPAPLGEAGFLVLPQAAAAGPGAASASYCRGVNQSGSPGVRLPDDSWPGREQGLVPADGPSTCARCKLRV